MKAHEAKSREDVWRILDGHSYEGREGLERQRTKKPLVKSYILETVPSDQKQPDLGTLLGAQHATLHQIDETLYRIDQPGFAEVEGSPGFLEVFERHPVIYTCHQSKDMDRWVQKFTASHKELDNLWISGRAFQELQGYVFRNRPEHRFGRLVFEHHAIYENRLSSLSSMAETDDEISDETSAEDVSGDNDKEDDEVFPERRSTKFSVMDRLGKLQEKLPRLQSLYEPFFSISQIRFPARERGGHDLFHWGKATNRSDSFQDHRQHVEHVLQVYRKSTEAAERAIWTRVEKNSVHAEGGSRVILGAPVFFRFSERLSQEVFDAFIVHTFGRAANKFRLWGNPIRMGPCKVHVYGLDRHLWQPIHLEITDAQIIAIVPEGSCGNSIHRLVTNIQHYLDPNVEVKIGDTPYEEFLTTMGEEVDQ